MTDEVHAHERPTMKLTILAALVVAVAGSRATAEDAEEGWEEIAADERVQLVSVATPDFAHTEPALALLGAGKHLLLEKPMATTSAECRRVLAAARTSGVRLMVNFHNRWHPPLARAKELRASGGSASAPRTGAPPPPPPPPDRARQP